MHFLLCLVELVEQSVAVAVDPGKQRVLRSDQKYQRLFRAMRARSWVSVRGRDPELHHITPLRLVLLRLDMAKMSREVEADLRLKRIRPPGTGRKRLALD